MTLEIPTRIFRDRRAAGRELGARLAELGLREPVVLGLARGGVPVAHEVARALGAPLDVLVVRKVGVPWHPELGMGAVAEGGAHVLDERTIEELTIAPEEVRAAVERAEAELAARVERYRSGRPPAALEGRTAVVVDDGLATGGTARAALRAVRARNAARVVLAVPVGAHRTVVALGPEADEIVCLREPERMYAVGAWYEDFGATGDDEVMALLDGVADPTDPTPAGREVRIPLGDEAALAADLVVPDGAAGLVVFAHGSGSGRHSPRNRRVAAALNGRGLATLLLDLLTPDEELDRRNVFDIPLLAQRLAVAVRWSRGDPALARLPVGLFGASTGAAAALVAAARLRDEVRGVVSRGGRPDLAGEELGAVRAPVLLIVGGRDDVVLELNRSARRRLGGPAELVVVPGATHLFEEPGALDAVADLAGDWLGRILGGKQR